jgi:hypothetical protein
VQSEMAGQKAEARKVIFGSGDMLPLPFVSVRLPSSRRSNLQRKAGELSWRRTASTKHTGSDDGLQRTRMAQP